MIATKTFKWEMAHKLSHSYTEKCQHIHGHSYKAEICVEADKTNFEGVVIDFSKIKEISAEFLNAFDHSFMYYSKDTHINGAVKESLSANKRRLIECDFEPTAENIAKYLFGLIEWRLQHSIKDENVKLKSVRVWETATCYAEAFDKGDTPLHMTFINC